MTIILSDAKRYSSKKVGKTLLIRLLLTSYSFRIIFLFRFLQRHVYSQGSISPFRLFLKFLYKRECRKAGIQMSLKADIGEGLKFEHYGGIVIGDVKIGKNCNIFHNVTLGYAGRGQKGGTPTIGDNVVIGAGAVVVGPCHIGNNVFIGANTYVYQDIPDNAVVAAQPGQIISYNGTKGYFGH